MMLQPTIDNLYALRLKAMAKALKEQLDNSSAQKLSFEERFGLIVDAQIYERENNLRERRFRQSKLKIQASPEDILYDTSRGLDRQLMLHLATCHYIDNAQNVIVTGPTGVGKTHLSCALGQAAIRKGKTVFSIRVARLFEDFQIAHGDGSIRKYRAKLSNFDLLILDDWALAPVTARARHELLELIDDRMGSGSIIITSQLPVDKWHDYLDEPTIAEAICDRIVQRAHRIELRGESLRKTDLSLSTDKEVKQ